MPSRRNTLLRSLLIIAAPACASHGDPLDDASAVAGWANASSALGAYDVAREPVALFDGKHKYADTSCPVAVSSAVSATVTGGCTDANGHAWTGSARVDRDIAGKYTVTLVDFGNDAFGGAVKTNGTVTIRPTGTTSHAFDVDTVTRGGITTTVQYSGTVDGTYDTATTWNGSGRIQREGDFYDGGVVEATTVNEVRDNAKCPGEGFSGTTTLVSSDHTVVITYDGITACDQDHSARWTRDGVDMGVIAGITCSAGGGSGAGMVAIALAGLFAVRRRRGELGSR